MNKLKKITFKIILPIMFFTLLVSPILSIADDDVTINPSGGKIINPLTGVSTIGEFIQKILEGALKISIPIIALAIIYCGFLFVSARGNSEKIGEAKEALMYTLIGAAILLGSWAIALLIKETIMGLS